MRVPPVITSPAPATCGCPRNQLGYITHLRGRCQDPLVAELQWWFDGETQPIPAIPITPPRRRHPILGALAIFVAVFVISLLAFGIPTWAITRP